MELTLSTPPYVQGGLLHAPGGSARAPMKIKSYGDMAHAPQQARKVALPYYHVQWFRSLGSKNVEK